MKFDVIVIGGGHAGCEAAVACSRLGKKTCLLTVNMDLIGQLSCNPAIGGTAKGHIVREIDALGGIMAKLIDKTGIQFRMLNRSRGPAVQSPRAQADKVTYRIETRKTIENQENLILVQDVATEIKVKSGKVCGISLLSGISMECDAVVVTTGTFLGGTIYIGEQSYKAGRTNELSSNRLADSLIDLGFSLTKMKTGTPPRVHKKTIDFSKMEEQKGDENPLPFSFDNEQINREQVSCYLTFTNEKTHKVIFDNLDRSPLFSGKIQGVGPRYCPSIEDKLKKFPDRDRHQVFLEPESLFTAEYYVNGVSTSLPVDVQEKYLKTIKGLEKSVIVRPGYAIEYYVIDSTKLSLSLQSKEIDGLFFAGQINGTSGYEEAAAQGLIAGINVATYLQNTEPLIIPRSEGYIGVMIDDLVTFGVDEPYRMFTSRAEFRLLLDHYSADYRLMKYGYGAGLVNKERYEKMLLKYDEIEQTVSNFKTTKLKDGLIDFSLFEEIGLERENIGSLYALLKRPAVTMEVLNSKLKNKFKTKYKIEVETKIKYEGYIERDRERLKLLDKLESVKVPKNFSYNISGISREIREKLEKIRPENLGQASRIPGVTPAAITILNVTISKNR
jgi:tRNA uridine 5-carboxymethylaminomethyl modification enzyme